MAPKLQDEFRPTMQRMNDTLSELVVGSADSPRSKRRQRGESVPCEFPRILDDISAGEDGSPISSASAGQLGTISARYKGRSKGRPTCSAK